MGMRQLPEDLGKYITKDVQLLRALGWKRFVDQKRGRGDFGDLEKVRHPANHLLRYYKKHGAPVKLSTPLGM